MMEPLSVADFIKGVKAGQHKDWPPYWKRFADNAVVVFEELKKRADDNSTWEFAENFVKTLPTTWYPALLLKMVEAAYAKNVFKDGGASILIKNLEKKLGVSGE